MKKYARLVDFELHIHKTFSNGKMVYISNVDIDEWNKLGIQDFSCWGRLGCRNSHVAIKISKFKIRAVQTQSNEKLTITRNVDLDVIDKLCIYDFSS